MAIQTPTRPAASVAAPAATGGLIIAGVLLAAFNLRTAVTSVGPLLDGIQRGLGMSSAVAGILTTLPVIAFAVLGGFTPVLVRRYGERLVLLSALILMAAGLIARAAIESVPIFLAASAVALAGGAVGNVALPSVVKQYFPDRVGPMTTAYSTALAVGAMVAAATTVPMEQLFGGHWQPALGIWALPALLAVVPWLALRRPRGRPGTSAAPVSAAPLRGLARNGLAWAMMLAFASQSLIAYVMFGWLPELLRDHGYSAAQAGLMLGVFTGISIPISLAVPVLAGRMSRQRGILAVLAAGYFLGMPALWLGGVSLITWVGLVLVAIGMGTFPLMLTLFALRTKTTAGTAALSAFAQSGGYLIAGIGPVLVGVFYESTGSWTAPFVMLLIAAVIHLVTGWATTAPRFLEDELPKVPATG